MSDFDITWIYIEMTYEKIGGREASSLFSCLAP